MNTTDRMPARAAAAATALARLPVRRAGEHLEAELAGGGQGDRDHAVLERVRRVAGVVLDPQPVDAELAGEVVGRISRVKPGSMFGVSRCRSAPAAGAGSARCSCGPASICSRVTVREVVGDLQRAEALRTGVERAESMRGSALAAGEARWRCRTRLRGAPGAAWTGCSRRPPSHLPHGRLSTTGRNWHLPRDPRRASRVVAGASAGRVPLPLSMSCPQPRQPSHHVHLGSGMWDRAQRRHSSERGVPRCSRRCGWDA